MKHRLGRLWITLRSSLWFVPSLIVCCLIGLALTLVELDPLLTSETRAAWPRLFGAGADGTRGMLSTIAGAMITVAGVVFSITIVALSLTSSQYSPRVLRNFMGDRTTQVVLGTFVGIYAYCLVVLRTIRGQDEGSFVPSIAALVAMLLALLGIALLIHFIHHISSAIQGAHILASIQADTAAAVGHLFPQELGDGDDEKNDGAAQTAAAAPRWQAVTAHRSGYIQGVDDAALMELSQAHDLLLRLPHRIGDFVIADTPLIELAADRPPAESLQDSVRSVFAIGDQRTVDQDPDFGIRQLVDIALRALSPGVNDATTAVMCLDHLSALLVRFARRKFPSRYRLIDGRLRVITAPHTFEFVLELAIGEIRLAAQAHPVVLRQIVRTLREAGIATRSQSRRRTVLAQLAHLDGAVKTSADRHARDALFSELQRAVAELSRELPETFWRGAAMGSRSSIE